VELMSRIMMKLLRLALRSFQVSPCVPKKEILGSPNPNNLAKSKDSGRRASICSNGKGSSTVMAYFVVLTSGLPTFNTSMSPYTWAGRIEETN
jgi:hypothetical protein